MAEARDTLRRMLGRRAGRAPVEDVGALAEELARALASRLAALTGGEPSVGATARPARLGEAPAEGALHALATLGGRLGALAVLPPETANRLIGATAGAPTKIGDETPPRRFTPIDMALAEPAANAAFSAFEAALSEQPGFGGAGRIRFERFALRLEDALGPHGDVEALAFDIEATLEEGAAPAALSLFAPLSTFDDYRIAPARTRPPKDPSADSAWGAAMRAAAANAPLPLLGVLHQRALNVGELEQLEPGAIIPLPRGHRLDVELRLDGPQGVARQPAVGRGMLGGADGWRAVRLSDDLAPELVAAVAPYVGPERRETPLIASD